MPTCFTMICRARSSQLLCMSLLHVTTTAVSRVILLQLAVWNCCLHVELYIFLSKSGVFQSLDAVIPFGVPFTCLSVWTLPSLARMLVYMMASKTSSPALTCVETKGLKGLVVKR